VRYSACPQYAIGGLLAGGGIGWGRFGGGVIGLLMVVVALLLLFKNRYPRDVLDVAMGCNRWAIRTLAFGTFLTPEYPPFRFGPGAGEPA